MYVYTVFSVNLCFTFSFFLVFLAAHKHPTTELDMGRVHPRVGLGRVGSICVGLCGSPWIIQNVTLSVIVKFTQFSELLVLLKLFSV